MKDSTERRFQRRISRLQQQVDDLKGSRDHWRDQAVRLAKQISRRAPTPSCWNSRDSAEQKEQR